VETSIRAAAAFKNPSAYMEFVTMLRDKTEELQAQAAVLLVPQAAVAFPQVGCEPSQQQQADISACHMLALRSASRGQAHQGRSLQQQHLLYLHTPTPAALSKRVRGIIVLCSTHIILLLLLLSCPHAPPLNRCGRRRAGPTRMSGAS
jgi:hypothetical protein